MALATEHVESDELGSNRFRSAIHLKSIGYRDGGSLYRNINEWVQGDATFPHVITHSQMLVYLRNSMAQLCPTRDPQRYIEFGLPYVKVGGIWTQFNLGAPTRTANKVMWQTLQANVWCEFGGHKLDIEIEFKGGWVPTDGQVAFPVGISGLTRTGNTFYQDGVAVITLQPMMVYDADKPMSLALPTTTQLVRVGGQWYAVVTLPTMSSMTRPTLH